MTEKLQEEILGKKTLFPFSNGSLSGKGLSNSGRKNTFQVLVVDDEYLIRYIVPKALKELGINVEVAENGLQAQKKIMTGHYDLVITDLNMPEMDGVALLAWIKEHRPHIEKIVMTGYGFTDLLSQNETDDIVDFLPKPFPVNKLKEAVKRSMLRVLHQQSPTAEINE